MSSKIFKLTPGKIKKIIAEERQKLLNEQKKSDAAKKKKLIEALTLYHKIKNQQKKSDRAINILKKYINENKRK
jgi:hypothetical protein